MSGWIKLHRQLLKWEWFTDVNTCHLFIYLLLSANYEDRKWHGIVVKRGQHCATRDELMRGTGLSARQIRTAVTKLKTTRVLSVERPNKITVYTIDKYEEYQHQIEESDQRNDQGCVTSTTKERPKNDQHIDKELKEDKNIRSKEKNLSLPSHENEFEQFWIEYGKIGTKQNAKKAFFKFKQEGINYETIIAGLRCYQSQCIALNTAQRYVKHASSWLNARGWEDEYPIHAVVKDTRSNRTRENDEGAARALASYLATRQRESEGIN